MKLFCSLPNTSLDWVHHDTQTSTTHSFLIEEWVRFQALGGGELGGVDYVDTVVGGKISSYYFPGFQQDATRGHNLCQETNLKQTFSLSALVGGVLLPIRWGPWGRGLISLHRLHFKDTVIYVGCLGPYGHIWGERGIGIHESHANFGSSLAIFLPSNLLPWLSLVLVCLLSLHWV